MRIDAQSTDQRESKLRATSFVLVRGKSWAHKTICASGLVKEAFFREQADDILEGGTD